MSNQDAIEAIRTLKAKYCRYADLRRWDDLQALFVPTGLMRFYAPDGSVTNEIPASSIATTLGGRVGHGQPIHHVFSHELAVDGEQGTGVWAMEDLIFHDLEAHPDSPFAQMHGFGHYHESYVLTPDGWRIDQLKLTRLRIDMTPNPHLERSNTE